MEDLTFLLVEDDEVDIMNVKRAFKKNHLSNTLFVAKNGLEALDILRSDTIKYPRAVLLDINMPKMNGLEFLHEVRNDEKLKDLVVFVLTTSNDDRDKIDAYNYNVAGYIVKPVSFDKFLEAIKSLSNYLEIIELIK